jgi:hypothetical protein
LDTAQIQTQQKRETVFSGTRFSHFLPFFIFLAVLTSFLFTNAVLPLYGLGFSSALLTVGSRQWLLLPTLILFPHWRLSSSLDGLPNVTPPVPLSLYETGLFVVAFVLVLATYLIALRFLPTIVTKRYLIISTALLGAACVCMTMVMSQDIFSYIIYARMGVIYHLNPITTIPLQISHDPVYPYIYWKDQPSAYGPTWIILTGTLQWLTAPFDKGSITPMILALRLLGFCAHLWSVLLVWSISDHLQGSNKNARQRMLATLAFAWNPLLLFEACVNAHNDTILLLFLLLALWSIVRTSIFGLRTAIFTTILLALATCLKVNIVLLFPGYMLFLWTKQRRIQTIALVLVSYAATIVTLYLPFWGNSAILNLVHVNPGTYRNINTPVEFLTHAINSLIYLLGGPKPQAVGSPAENILHTSSLIIFVFLYGFLCLRSLSTQYSLRTPLQLIRWMACGWFLYCAFGAPWFWPWYLVTFFGLFTLLEAADPRVNQSMGTLKQGYLPLLMRILAFSMLSLYCFYPWGLYVTTISWLPDFRLIYLKGLWAWGLPLLLVYASIRLKRQHPVPTTEEPML